MADDPTIQAMRNALNNKQLSDVSKKIIGTYLKAYDSVQGLPQNVGFFRQYFRERYGGDPILKNFEEKDPNLMARLLNLSIKLIKPLMNEHFQNFRHFKLYADDAMSAPDLSIAANYIGFLEAINLFEKFDDLNELQSLCQVTAQIIENDDPRIQLIKKDLIQACQHEWIKTPTGRLEKKESPLEKTAYFQLYSKPRLIPHLEVAIQQYRASSLKSPKTFKPITDNYMTVEYCGHVRSLKLKVAMVIKYLHKRKGFVARSAEIEGYMEDQGRPIRGRMRDLFKGCWAWKTLVQRIAPGTYELNIDPT